MFLWLNSKEWGILLIGLILQIIIPELFPTLINKLIDEISYWSSLIIENLVRLIIIIFMVYFIVQEENKENK